MDFIQRLALLLLLSIGAFMPNSAHADYPKTFSHYLLNNWGVTDASYQTLCTAFVNAKRNSYPSENIQQTSCTEVQVQAQGWSAGATYYSNAISKYGTCAGVSSLWGNGICTGSCPAPYVMTNGQCMPPPSCTPPQQYDAATNTCIDPCKAKEGQIETYFTTVDSASDSCVGGCVVKMAEGDCGYNTAGQIGCFFEGYYTGVSCDGTQPSTGSKPNYDSPNTPEYDCIKQGKTWGTANGTTVCLSKGTSGSSPTKSYDQGTKTTTTNPDGTKTTTQDPPKVTTMGSGSGSNTKVTETTTNPDGTTSTKESDASTYCQQNPNADVCKQLDKGSFGGACDSGFTCDGDAAQCATAREIHTRNCEIFKPDAELTNKYNEAKSDNGSSNSSLPQNASIVNIPTSLDASSPYASQCFSDLTVTIGSTSLTLPFSSWCTVLQSLGYLFLALSYISAAMILGGIV